MRCRKTNASNCPHSLQKSSETAAGTASRRCRRNRPNRRTRNAQRRCRRNSFQWRLRRHLRKTCRRACANWRRQMNRFFGAELGANLRLHSARRILALFASTSVLAFTLPAGHLHHCTFASPEQHLVEVQIILPAGAAERELQLPVWNALYQVRDFAQYINWIRAKDRAGKPLAVRELNKSRWQIHGAASGAIVEYQIYVDSPAPSARNSIPSRFLESRASSHVSRRRPKRAHHRAFQPASRGMAHRDCRCLVRRRIHADNYDRLVDSPVEIGNFQESDFDEGRRHTSAS